MRILRGKKPAGGLPADLFAARETVGHLRAGTRQKDGPTLRLDIRRGAERKGRQLSEHLWSASATKGVSPQNLQEVVAWEEVGDFEGGGFWGV
jgi:hypothetical protein